MEQQTAARQVTKQYNGIRFSAGVTTASPDGNNYWTGAIIAADGTTSEDFVFFERDQAIMLPNSRSSRQMYAPELEEFARFCAEVSQAHI